MALFGGVNVPMSDPQQFNLPSPATFQKAQPGLLSNIGDHINGLLSDPLFNLGVSMMASKSPTIGGGLSDGMMGVRRMQSLNTAQSEQNLGLQQHLAQVNYFRQMSGLPPLGADGTAQQVAPQSAMQQQGPQPGAPQDGPQPGGQPGGQPQSAPNGFASIVPQGMTPQQFGTMSMFYPGAAGKILEQQYPAPTQLAQLLRARDQSPPGSPQYNAYSQMIAQTTGDPGYKGAQTAATEAATVRAQNGALTPDQKNMMWAYGNTPTARQALVAKESQLALPGAMGGAGGGGQGLTGDAYLATVPANMAAMIKGIASGKMQMPSGYMMKTPFGQALVQGVFQYNPNFDGTFFGQRQKTADSVAAGDLGKTSNYLNTAINHLSTYGGLIAGLNNGQYPTWNAFANAYAKQTGQTAPTNIEAVKNALASELTSVYRSSGGSEQDVQAFKSSLDSAGTPQQLHGVLSNFAELLNGKLDAVQQQVTRGLTVPGAGSDTLISPQAQKALSAIRHDSSAVQIPDGQTATNPQTGARMMFRGGKWQPM